MNILEEFKKAQKMMGRRMYDEAEKIFQNIIDNVENLIPVPERNLWLAITCNNLGFMMYKKVEFNKAQELYRKSIQFNPSYAPAYYNNGLINYRLGLYESAVKDLRRAVQLKPENSEFLIGLQACETALNENNQLVT